MITPRRDRRLVAPEARIKQLRRIEALASMRMITNASLYHGYYHGGSATLEELFAGASLEPADLYDPQGGSFAWDPGEARVSSSVWGDLRFMTPLIEIDIDHVKPMAHFGESTVLSVPGEGADLLLGFAI